MPWGIMCCPNSTCFAVSAAAMPEGACTSDSDCAKGLVCSSASPVQVCKCLGGIDSCDFAGTCAAPPPPPPPPPPQLTPCEQCQACLQQVEGFTRAAAAGSSSADSLASQLAAWCAENSVDSSNCRTARRAIRNSYNGNVAKRAGEVFDLQPLARESSVLHRACQAVCS